MADKELLTFSGIDLSELAICPAPPVMSREEFEARKAEVRRKREMERRSER